MTNEEAIKQIKTAQADFEWEYPYRDTTGFDMAIKALENQDVLDKIRAEINEYKSTIDIAISEDELKIEGMKEAYEDCLEIIDKYMVESENKDDF